MYYWIIHSQVYIYIHMYIRIWFHCLLCGWVAMGVSEIYSVRRWKERGGGGGGGA